MPAAIDKPTSPAAQSSPPVLRPEPSAWAGLLTSRAASRASSETASEFRGELGLPTDRPVIMSGHQAQFWHPGILAKRLAADALAARMGAAVAWLVVDQDANPPGVVRLPVRRAPGDPSGRALRVETWHLDPRSAREHGDTPTGRMLPLKPAPLPTLAPGETWAAPGVGPRAESIRAALTARATEASAAAQVAASACDLLKPLVRTPALVVFSLAISRTTLFRRLIERLRREPAACVRAYNVAVAEHPRERIQPLGAGELPLWVIPPGTGAARRRASMEDLGSTPVEHLAPRALFMTGLLRLAGCDLFIHGTGGGGEGAGAGPRAGERAAHAGYDRITERWLASWLGEEGARLAPSVVATATLRLGIDHAGPGPEELRRAQWLAHRALHEPALLGDPSADARKRAMVDSIRAARRRGEDARPLYRDMHALLARAREDHAARLRELQELAGTAAAGLGDAEIAADRTWAFPLYQPEQLVALRDEVWACFDTPGDQASS